MVMRKDKYLENKEKEERGNIVTAKGLTDLKQPDYSTLQE
jgi:hypothetical protein